MQLEKFNEKANKAIEELKAAKPKEVMTIHHDDADGLCSAAITKKSFSSKNWKCQFRKGEGALTCLSILW